MTGGRSVSFVAHLVVALAVLPALQQSPAQASSYEYVLGKGSSIITVCYSCGTPPSVPQPLGGSFQLTSLPVSSGPGLAALTDLDLHGDGIEITGTGFLQRLGRDRQAMVVSANINGADVLLRSGRRQFLHDDAIRLILSSGSGTGNVYIVVIRAEAVRDNDDDADRDGVVDNQDNCPGVANGDQSDGDEDGVGDACDACGDSGTGLKNASGCTIEQVCPCHETVEGETWSNRSQYLRCVGKAVRVLRREGQLSPGDAWRLVRDAAASSCGRTVVALW